MVIKSKKEEMAGPYRSNTRDENVFKILVRKCEKNRPLGRSIWTLLKYIHTHMDTHVILYKIN
jgi:hypothetical protein